MGFFFRVIYLYYVPGMLYGLPASRRRGRARPGRPSPRARRVLWWGRGQGGLSRLQGMPRRGRRRVRGTGFGQGGLEARLCVRVDRRRRDGRGGHSSIQGRDAGRWRRRGVADPGARPGARRSRGTGLGAGPGGRREGRGTATQELREALSCAPVGHRRWALRRVLRCVQVAGLGRGPGPLLRRRPPGAGSSPAPHRAGGGVRGAEGAGAAGRPGHRVCVPQHSARVPGTGRAAAPSCTQCGSACARRGAREERRPGREARPAGRQRGQRAEGASGRRDQPAADAAPHRGARQQGAPRARLSPRSWRAIRAGCA